MLKMLHTYGDLNELVIKYKMMMTPFFRDELTIHQSIKKKKKKKRLENSPNNVQYINE